MEADYAALRLRPGATPIEVRRAYIELSRRHHPDKGGDATLFRRAKRKRPKRKHTAFADVGARCTAGA